MKLIKLNAIGSTNTFLRDLSTQTFCDNFTVVSAQYQTQGKGQLGAVWEAKSGKNLTFSVLLTNLKLKTEHQFYLSMFVSVVLAEVLACKLTQKISVKWPNDILADGYKIGGILIENTVKGAFIDKSIIGIGINVNQKKFPASLSKATSLSICSKLKYDLDRLLMTFIKAMESQIALLSEENHEILKIKYFLNLYKYQTPCMFRLPNNIVFMGRIVGISNTGKLQLELENGIVKYYNLKEIAFNEF